MKDTRLLLVTDPRPDLVERVAAGLRGGVDIVQLRDKHASRQDLLPLAEELREACEQAGAWFTVNDDVELTRLSGAVGIHLGEDDAQTPEARST
ncbi:MAG: thiamine phosphate synthase, partial [Rubrobacteraceae bacterium]